ncbi:MAG: iron-sulfur cluster assembly accessory protein [Methylococcales symbiont of Iophon sp. n. MRB-2018]|nr:MAG: iron-sulfur cluster assembly accessory protein [Methylococcales symbiont of Iophon sp. n. MRB-2018]KAF3980393.1 MAG: iron-sulfur cluster assembly accessory protein [Methylococcales symbiont of Iophon sp. n. MRB-2018]
MVSESLFNTQLTDEINISESAVQQFISLTEDEPDILGVRIFVSGGGCDGMKYGMTFVEETHGYDCILKAKGLNVYVDVVTLSFLAGVEIDYVTEGVNKNFVFKNAFAQTGGAATCGSCGAAGGGCGS